MNQTVTPLVDVPAPVVAPSPLPPRVEADEPQRSRFWSVVRWPLHQVLKGIFLAAAFLARRRAVAIGLVVALVVGLGGWWLLAQRVSTTPRATTPAHVGTGTNGRDPVVYYSDGLAPLPWSVGQLLTGLQAGNAQQFYNQLTPTAQKAAPLTKIQSLFDFYKQNNVTFQQFIYTGGFYIQGNVSNYTVQVVGTTGGKVFVSPWYFQVDTSNKIVHFADIDQLIGAFDTSSQSS